LQPETYKTLYMTLLNINARVKAALGEDDAQTFMQLAEEHRNIINKLDQKGLSQDADLLDLVEEAREQVYEIAAEIGKHLDELSRQLVMFEKKKRASAAYAKNV
jgi:predicted GTPase